MSKAKKSEFRGVTWDVQILKWRAKICINGTRIYLGVFEEHEERKAAIAYDRYAICAGRKTNILKPIKK